MEIGFLTWGCGSESELDDSLELLDELSISNVFTMFLLLGRGRGCIDAIGT